MRSLWFGCLSMMLLSASSLSAQEKPRVNKSIYCRFQAGDVVAYGFVEGDKVRQLDGDLFKSPKSTQKTFPLKDVKLLVPCEPKNVFAMAGNYQSHLGG